MSSPEIMRRIVEAEKESKRILDETAREIAETRKDLPKQIASMRQQILRDASTQVKKMQAEGEKSAAEVADRIASEARKQVEALSKIPESKRKQAVERAIKLLFS